MTHPHQRAFFLASLLSSLLLAACGGDEETTPNATSPGSSAGASAGNGGASAGGSAGANASGVGGASAGSAAGGAPAGAAGTPAAGAAGTPAAGAAGTAGAGGDAGVGGDAGSGGAAAGGSSAGGASAGSSAAGSGAGGEAGSSQAGAAGEAGEGGQAGSGPGGSGPGGEAGTSAAGGASGTGLGGTGGSDAGGSGGSAAGGSGGSAAGGSAAGGPASGSGGSAGGAGSSGGAGNPAFQRLGAQCKSDADCDGGQCLLPGGVKYKGGGPASGMCVLDCTAWNNNPSGPDPCVEFPGADVAANAHCVEAGGASYCLRSCQQGEPAGSKLDPGKCFGRSTVACVSETDASGAATRSYCAPQCAVDSQCGAGLQCDQGLGVCKGQAKVAKKTGDLCDITVEGDCEGECARLYDPGDPQTPVSKKNYGVCVDPCVFGPTLGCGGSKVGFCGLNVFTPIDPETGQIGSLGAGDLGGCAEVTEAGNDAKCLWQEGWFATQLEGLPTLCLPAKPCPKGAADCAGTGLACRKVDGVCGRSFCLDHDVTGLPVQDPLLNCDPGQGG